MTKTNCIKCFYPRGEAKGARVCRNCGRPENIARAEWRTLRSMKDRYNAEAAPARDELVAKYMETLAEAASHENAAEQSGGAPESSPPTPASAQGQSNAFAGAETTFAERASAMSLEAARALIEPGAAPSGSPEASSSAPAAASMSGSAAYDPGERPLRPLLVPAHSPYGGSSAKRWLNCSLSVALIGSLRVVDEVEPDWTREGKQAHELAAYCLEAECDAWEAMASFHKWPDVTGEMALAVQVYLDYIRSLPGRRNIEFKMHRPNLHELFFGTLDCCVYSVFTPQDGVCLRVIDYKHGVGVPVYPEENEQLKYYAVGYIDEHPDWWPDESLIELTVVQPRCGYAEGGPIRSWRISVGDLREWRDEVLLPGMRLKAKDMVLSLGDWCQFCPAKVICPAMQNMFALFDRQSEVLEGLDGVDSDQLGQWLAAEARVKEFIAAVKKVILARLIDGKVIADVKLVAGKSDRVFKESVEQDGTTVTLAAAALERFGTVAWTPPKLLSPAQMENLPGGADFVAAWAYKPEVGPTVAVASDRRHAVTPRAASSIFSNIPQSLLDIVDGQGA